MNLIRKFWKLLNRNLLTLIFLGVWLLIMMFINFNAKVAQNAKVAKDTAASTHQIVTNQEATLKAIQQLATDTNITSEQRNNIIICMLQVPIAERTTDTLNNCRKQATTSSSSPSPVSSTKTNNPTNTQVSQNTDSTNPPTQAQGDNSPPQGTVRTLWDGLKTGTNTILNKLGVN